MSADNYITVYPNKTTGGFIVAYGCASIEQEDCLYRGTTLSEHQTREEALTAAHDEAKKVPILEYGVTESSAIPGKCCGRCYVCINERHVIADDIARCDECHEPITTSDWRVMTQGKTYHHRCEPC